MNTEHDTHDTMEQLERDYFEPDDAMTAKMIYESVSDERALAVRRLIDDKIHVLDMADLELAFGTRVA